MRKLILALALMIGVMAQAQVEIYTFDETEADSLRRKWHEHAALDPVPLPDGSYALPKRINDDPWLDSSMVTVHSFKDDSTEIRYLPEVGQEVTAGVIYHYPRGNDPDLALSDLVLCRQTHNLTIYPPEETPALFTFFRVNSDTLSWIENEWVKLGWIRVYDGTSYEVIQAHMTVVGQTPDIVPALWTAVSTGCEDFVQPTGAQDAYQTGDCVIFEGSTYESLIDDNVWSPTTYPAGWQLIE